MQKSKLLSFIYTFFLLICQREMQMIQNLFWRDKKEANPKLDEPTIIEHLQTKIKEFDHFVLVVLHDHVIYICIVTTTFYIASSQT